MTASTYAPSRSPGAPPDLPDVIVTARSLEEYVAAFGLTDDDLRRRIVDCSAGAASAVAEIAAAGGSALAVDPEYALGADEFRSTVTAGLERSMSFTHTHDRSYDWDVGGGVAGHEVTRRRAAETMLADLAVAPERYVAGSLPHLPLASDSADLALCSHLLFTYADRMDREAHVEAIVEMARVAPEVRVYPLVDYAGNPLPELVRSVISRLKKERLTSRIEPVTRPFQRAATTRLVVERTRRRPR